MKIRLPYLCFFFFLYHFLSPHIIFAQVGEDSVDVSLDSLLNVRVSRSMFDTQINAAAKYGQNISEVPASATVITSEDIAQFGYQTLDEVLRSVRGFYTSYDRNYVYLGVRGFGRPTDYNDRILLQVNGHSMNEYVYFSAPIGTDLGLNMDDVDRIEIIRGPGSALYGTNAMFAVINIIMKQGSTLDGMKISGTTGSYQRYEGAISVGKEFDNGLDLALYGNYADVNGSDQFYKEFNSPETNFGIAQNVDWDKYYSITTTASYDHFNFLGSIISRSKGIPTGSFDVIFNDRRSKTIDERKFFDLTYDHNFSSNTSLILRGYYDHYGYYGSYPYNPIPQEESTVCHWFGSELQIRWDILANNRIIAGTEYKNIRRADYNLWTPEKTIFYINVPFTIFSTYIQDEYRILENLSFTLGLRYDHYSTVGNSTTPRIALLYNPVASSTFKFLYGEAFRAPNLYESSYDDKNAGYKANPNLRPEKIRTTELIWEQRFAESLYGSISLYHYGVQDLIDTKIDLVDSLKQYQNVNRVNANGIEFELNAHLIFGINGYMSFAYQKAKDADSSRSLTNSPNHLFKIGLTYPFLTYLRASFEMQYESGRITVKPDEISGATSTKSYLLANIHLTTIPLFDHLTISCLMRNLFNTSYSLPGGVEHRQAGIIQDGRNILLKIGLKF